MTFGDLIELLESDNSRLKKEEHLRQAFKNGMFEFFEASKYALDGLVTFNIKKVPEKTTDNENNLTWVEFKTLLDDLYARKVTGNKARDLVNDAMNKASKKEWDLFYKRILLKDLKCGVQNKTINKILEEFGNTDYQSKDFPCQLANPAKHTKNSYTGKKMLDAKLDGVRLISIIDIDKKEVIQFTRNGKTNDRFINITNGLKKLIPFITESIVLDGEVVSKNFQELMTQVNRKKNVDTSDARLALFDYVPLKDFVSKTCKLTLTERHNKLVGLTQLLAEHTDNSVYILPKLTVDLDTEQGQRAFNEMNKEVLEQGLEGIMLKDPEGLYEGERTNAWLKLKPFITVSLAITGVEYGTPGTKNEFVMGNLLLEGEDEGKFIKTSVGAFSDKFRKDLMNQYNKDPKSILGLIVEVTADGLTKAKNNDHYSLRFPEFKTIRGFDIGEKI